LLVKRSALSLHPYAARVFACICMVSTLKPAPSSLQVLFHHAAKVRVLCVFKALDAKQIDEISLKEFYKFYDVLSLRWERVSTWSTSSIVYCSLVHIPMQVASIPLTFSNDLQNRVILTVLHKAQKVRSHMALTVYVCMLQMNVHVCMYVCMFCSVQCIYINRLITRESPLCGTRGCQSH